MAGMDDEFTLGMLDETLKLGEAKAPKGIPRP